MKVFIKNIIYRSRLIRRIVGKLNQIIRRQWYVNDPSEEYVRELFNEKSTYLGFSTDYYNLRLETKKEREIELKRTFFKFCHYYLDLDNPTTFNQKVQWMKLNYCTPEMEECVDKYRFKGFVEREFGKEFVVPCYGAWDNENMIDFTALPDRFVLKSNLQSDAKHIMIIKNKRGLNYDMMKTVLSQWLLPKNTLINSYCLAYRNATPCIVAEEFLDSGDKGIDDYKFYCYNGTCRHFLVCKDRGAHTKYINYDMDMNCFTPSKNSYYTTEKFVRNPDFEIMLEKAEKVAKKFPFVRVDYYYVNGHIYVGELTFYPGAGYNTYDREWDEKFGSYFQLPEPNDN